MRIVLNYHRRTSPSPHDRWKLKKLMTFKTFLKIRETQKTNLEKLWATSYDIIYMAQSTFLQDLRTNFKFRFVALCCSRCIPLSLLAVLYYAKTTLIGIKSAFKITLNKYQQIMTKNSFLFWLYIFQLPNFKKKQIDS